MDLLEFNFLKKIDNVYKKSFIITFLICIVVFFTIISNVFWGNHDWENIEKSIILSESLFICRFGATILQTLFCLKLMPYIVYLADITVLIVSMFMIADYWNIKKTVANLTLFSLFWILMPTSLCFFYYQAASLGIFASIFFSVLSLKLCLKINDTDNKNKKILYFISSFLILYVFVLGTYPSVLNAVFVFLTGKLLIEYKNSNFEKNFIFKFLKENKYFIINLCLALIFIYLTFNILSGIGVVDNTFYNVRLVKTGNLIERFLFVIKLCLSSFVLPAPFESMYVRILTLLLFVSVVFIFVRSLKNTNLSDNAKIDKFFIISFLFFIMFVMSLFTYFIIIGVNEISPRINHLGFDFVYLFFVAVLLNENNLKIKNINVIIMLLFIYNSAVNSMYAQKIEYLSFNNELMLQNRLLTRITSEENFDINKKYKYLQVGHYNLYNGKFYGEYDNKIRNDELLRNEFISKDGVASGLMFLSNKDFIILEDSYSYELDDNFDEQMYDELYDFIMNKAKIYPSKDSIFISEHYILVVFDQLYLDFLKTKIRK